MDIKKDIAHHGNDKRRLPRIKHPLLDTEGHMVYQDKHWRPLNELDPAHLDDLLSGKSDATKMEKGEFCDGVLHLSGTFLEKHREEILGVAENMGKHASDEDITNTIINIEKQGDDKYTVYTAKNQLAVRIGKKVADSYKGGELKIHWSKGDMPVEVWWHKDLDERDS